MALSNLKHEQDPWNWCKHVAAAFYIVAQECDTDWRFVFLLSGKNIVAQLDSETAQQAGSSSIVGGSRNNPIDLSQ